MFTINSRQQKTCAFLDVGSAGIGGAVVLLQAEEWPQMVYAIHRRLTYFSTQGSFEPNVKDLFPLIRQVLQELTDVGKRRQGGWQAAVSSSPFDAVVCTVSSPWNRNRVTVLQKNDQEPVEVTESTVRTLLDQEAEKFLRVRSSKSKGVEEDRVKPDKLVGQQILNSRLNGYLTSSVVGQKAKEIEINVLLSSIAGELYDFITAEVPKITGCSERVWQTYPRAAQTVLEALFPDLENYLYLEVTGNTTDLFGVNNKKIVNAESVSAGTEVMTRSVSEQLQVPYLCARSYISAGADGVLDPEFESKLRQVSCSGLESWEEELSAMMDKVLLTKDDLSSVFLAVPHIFKGEFKEAVSRVLKRKGLEIDEQPRVVVLEEKVLRRFLHRAPASGEFDLFLVMGVLSLVRQLNNGQE